MDSDAPSSKVVYAKHAADDIPAHVVEHQDLPNRVAIFIENRRGDETLS
jgi:hypothetical protein